MLNLIISSIFKDPMTASILIQRNTGSSKALNKPSLDTLFSNMWLLEEKSGKALSAAMQNVIACLCFAPV